MGGDAEKTEEELSFVAGWRRNNNLLIFGTDKYSHKSYSDTLKTTEYIVNIK